jgi:hypothetical protein
VAIVIRRFPQWTRKIVRQLHERRNIPRAGWFERKMVSGNDVTKDRQP